MKRLAIVAAATLLGACGSDNTLTLRGQIEVTVQGQNRSSYQFFADQSRGQLSQQVNVLIRNSGGGPLKIGKVAFKTQNLFLSMSYPRSKPTFPLSLKENGSLMLTVKYQPDGNQEDAHAAVLEIQHDDQDRASPIKVTFTIQQTGCKLSVQNKDYPFTNPSKFNPPHACFKFGNEGNGECVFKDAYFATATAYYTITKAPHPGDSIGPKGSDDNPTNNPKFFEVCVRLSPEGPDKDYSTQLVFETSDKSNPKAKVALSAKWEKTNVFKITSDHPQGLLAYDFTGVTGGAKTRCLNIYDEGPSPWLLNTVEVVAHDSSQQSAAKDQYEVEFNRLNTITGNLESVKGTPFSVGAGKSLNICITFHFPADGSPVAAFVRWNYVQATVADRVEFPIIAGACDSPQAVFAPAGTPLWLMGDIGATDTATLVVANQSCAPLTIIKGCVTRASGVGIQDPCQQPNLVSADFTLKTDVGLKTIPAWGLLPIDLDFAPPSANSKNIHHLLNITYCAGPFADNKCGGAGAVNRILNVSGYVGKDIKRPALKLAVAEGSERKVGVPLKVEAIATEGDFPINEYGGYLWFLKSRPAASKLWLSGDLQLTDEPWLTLKPDAAGKYELVAATQSVKSGTSTVAWSPQVTIVLDVAAK